MAEEKRALKLRYSKLVAPRLAEIWRYTAQRYGFDQAVQYLQFLDERTENIGINYMQGREIPAQSGYRFQVLQSRSKGHGYAVVYEVRESEIFIFDYYHAGHLFSLG